MTKDEMKGQLIILTTGCMIADCYGGIGSDRVWVDSLINKLEDNSWHLSNSVFVETYRLFDSRNSQSKTNRGFCKKVNKAVDEGASVFIVVPDLGMVDKRLRDRAVVLSMPRKSEMEME